MILLQCHIGLGFVFAILSAITAVRVWRVRPRALFHLRCFWLAWLGWQGLFILLFVSLNPQPESYFIEWSSVIGSFLALGICWLYFSKSLRVAATFGPWAYAAFSASDGVPLDKPSDMPLWWWACAAFSASDGAESPPAVARLAMASTQRKGGDAVADDEETMSEQAPREVAEDVSRFAPPQAEEPATAMPAPPLDDAAMMEVFARVAQENAQGQRHEGAWLLALSRAQGDEAKASLHYHDLRAQMLVREELGGI